MNRRCGYALILLLSGLLFSCSEETTRPDATSPNAVRDLSVVEIGGVYTLEWSAPGDDLYSGQAAQYDIRYSAGSISDLWDDATAIPFPPQNPAPAGEKDSVLVPTLSPGTWQFALKAADEVHNWSAISNVVSITVTLPDTIPPAPVPDLKVKAVTQGMVTLEWTAPGGDGQTGQATSYDLRYTTGSMTPETWAAATPVAGLGAPGAAGTAESFVVNSLEVGQTYEFALKTADESLNWSSLSNVVTATVSAFGPYQLTFNQTYHGAGQADWSPDGSKIAFAMGVYMGPDMLRPQIHVVDSGGGQPSQYTSFTPEGAGNPIWSRDGQRFYFLKNLTVQNIYTKSALAVMDAVPGATYTVLASYGLENVGSIALSPDGSRIAYWVGNNTPGQPTSQAIYTNSTEGNDPRVLVSNIAVTDLDWSPDGSELVYCMKQDGVINLWVIPSGGGESTQMTTGEDDKWDCAWSPDGDEIAFTSAGTIWAIPSSGGEPRRITTDSSDLDWGIRGISWSPDGTKLAYEKYVGSIRNIWITTAD